MRRFHQWVEQNQPVRFVEFMQQALYSPTMGYYTTNTNNIGQSGDFITAPELTPLFGQTLANQCQSVLSHLPGGHILEFGAGTGRLCVDILTALQKKDALPPCYHILEVSGALKARQQQTIAQCIPHLADRVHWLDAWPEAFTGVMIANEVFDAMPVHRFKFADDTLWESHIALGADEQLIETWEALKDTELQAYLSEHILSLPIPQPYCSEVNWLARGWVEQLADSLEQGVFIGLDYGFPRHEYYHPDRHMGTLMCHHQHHSHGAFLSQPGDVDITAHVDFTLIAETAQNAGLHVAGYTNQAAFLINNDLLRQTDSDASQAEQLKQAKAINCLTHPAEMGELFKVIALTKAYDQPLSGFNLFDKRVSL